MGYDTIASSGSTLPPGFLDDLINRFDNEPEGLKNVFEQLFKDLQKSVMKISPLGPFQGYLRALGLLAYCYTPRCVVKTSKASADIHKVAGLAAASVVCFSLQAFVVLFFDNPVSFYFC
ncbi:unnamed protein product [Sphagnum balticum]